MASSTSSRWLTSTSTAAVAAARSAQQKHRHIHRPKLASALIHHPIGRYDRRTTEHQKAVLRWHSSTSAPNKYLYPMRTEHPHITTTQASDDTNTDNNNTNTTEYEADREALTKQKAALNTELHPKHKILTEPPAYLRTTPTSSSSSSTTINNINTIPQTILSTVDLGGNGDNNNNNNNLRVASQELPYGQIATIGLLLDVGSRHENLPHYTGINHAMEILAFQSSEQHPVAGDIAARMDALGGVTFANSSREQLLYCIDILREGVDEACAILAGTVLQPLLTDEEMEEVRQTIVFQNEGAHNPMLPDMAVMEGLHGCAYNNQPLGRPHLCPVEAVANLDADTIREFRGKHFTADRMVLAGAGIEHEKLLELADVHLSHIPTSNHNRNHNHSQEVSEYTGGEYRQQCATVDGYTRIAVAFELAGGWDQLDGGDLVPACVLQVLLGGGSSFSAGGPGKGMYSRLYREVLNRYYWVEAAEAFTSFHSESGLIGIKGSAPPLKSTDLTRLFCEHFAKIAMHPVDDEELDRAKNMLKCNVLTQLESRLVLFEDIGRQILTYGQREGIGKTCERIDAVSKEDIMKIAKKALSKPPSISAVGDDLSNVPSFDEVNRWFRGS